MTLSTSSVPATSPTVVVTAKTLARSGIEVLEQAGCRIIFVRDGSLQSLLEVMRREPVDALLCRSVCPAEVLRAGRHLKIVSRHGVGFDSVDVAAASALGIPVAIAAGANAQSVVEIVFGLLGAVARDLPGHTARIRGGQWERTGAGLQLSGKTLGIVGLGNIGAKVAALGQAYGMRVLAFDIRDRSGAVAGVEMLDSLEALLSQAHVLSLHVPLTPLTRDLIDAVALSQMREGTVLINTSRGEVVVEQALHDALISGHLRGAGLDVHQHERVQADNALRQLPNVVMSPHVGAQTDTALEQVAQAAAQNIVDVLQGRTLSAGVCVNFAALGYVSPAAL